MLVSFFSMFFKLTEVEIWAVAKAEYLLGHLFAGGIKGATAALVSVAQIFSFIVSRTPITPFGDELDLSGYELVFEDEFEGDALNTDVWRYRQEGKSNKGLIDRCEVSVQNGNLLIGGEYLTDGPRGTGWYTGSVCLRERYLYGYYEIRCKINKGRGFWSAFWLQHENSSKLASNGGKAGCEIDIMESCANNSDYMEDKDCVIQCLHVNGGTGDTTEKVDTSGVVFMKADDPYEEYNTYGVLWTPEEYIFYVNGVESWRSSWRDGTSEVPEELIVSMSAPAINMNDYYDTDYKTVYTVDYVRIYQLQK